MSSTPSRTLNPETVANSPISALVADDLPDIARPLNRHSTEGLDGGRREGSIDNYNGSSPTGYDASPGAYSVSSEGALSALHTALCNVPHFSTIPYSELSKLQLKVREFSAMDSVMEAGAPVQQVQVLVSGAVEVFNPPWKEGQGRSSPQHGVSGPKRVGRLTAPSVFGMDRVLFDRECKYTMRAGTNSKIILVNKADFFRLIREHRVFAYSVSSPIITQLSAFQNFQTLCRSIFAVSSSVAESGFSEAYLLNFAAIVQAYLMIPNVMHVGQKSDALDLPAWTYACRRLPANIVETHVLTLCRSLPPFIAKELSKILEGGDDAVDNASVAATGSPMGIVKSESMTAAQVFSNLQRFKAGHLRLIPTADRRRRSIQVSRGHTMVLLREGFTDILDIVSCLCIHHIEAKKIRIRLQSLVDPPALQILQEGLAEWNLTIPAERETMAMKYLEKLQFTGSESKGLYGMWPNSVLHRLTALLTSREDVNVRLDNTLARRFDTDPYLQWALTIRRHLMEALSSGGDPLDEIPEETVIDLMFGNTHTTKNLLSSFARTNKSEILDYGDSFKKQVMQNYASESADGTSSWRKEEDLLYYLASNSHGRDQNLTESKMATLASEGFVVIESEDHTGLQADIIDVDALNAEKVDSELKPAFAARQSRKERKGRHFILNVDFAFGAQADGILRALILTFGKRIRSTNVMSKCGGFSGKFGDVVLPEKLIFSKEVLGDDTQDEQRPARNQDISVERLTELLNGDDETSSSTKKKVLTGPVVTIPGLVLQNQSVLKYYHNMWACEAVEMEASYYARQVEESIGLDLVRPDIATRFVYHIIDLPLGGPNNTRVGAKPTPEQVVPGMYAIARALLEQIVSL